MLPYGPIQTANPLDYAHRQRIWRLPALYYLIRTATRVRFRYRGAGTAEAVCMEFWAIGVGQGSRLCLGTDCSLDSEISYFGNFWWR